MDVKRWNWWWWWWWWRGWWWWWWLLPCLQYKPDTTYHILMWWDRWVICMITTNLCFSIFGIWNFFYYKRTEANRLKFQTTWDSGGIFRGRCPDYSRGGQTIWYKRAWGPGKTQGGGPGPRPPPRTLRVYPIPFSRYLTFKFLGFYLDPWPLNVIWSQTNLYHSKAI